jgi:hypothetical protein
MLEARNLMASMSFVSEAAEGRSANASDETLADVVLSEADRPPSTLAIPASRAPLFDQPEYGEFRQDLALTADQLIGLMGTLSLFILMPEDRRLKVFEESRRLLKEALGVEGPVTVDVTFKTEVWRSRRSR